MKWKQCSPPPAVAQLSLVRPMKSLATITLFAFASVAFAAGEKPSADVFHQSPFEFTFKVPAAFTLTASNTGYFPTPMRNVPYEEKAWQSKADTISTKVTVMPDAWWQTRAAGAFAEAKDNMLREPGVRLIAERDYSVGGSRAHSLVVALKNQFQRIDYYLMKPDLRVVMYLSPKDGALTDAACKSLFDSVAITPKGPHK
jgi:hypothetical protein